MVRIFFILGVVNAGTDNIEIFLVHVKVVFDHSCMPNSLLVFEV